MADCIFKKEGAITESGEFVKDKLKALIEKVYYLISFFCKMYV